MAYKRGSALILDDVTFEATNGVTAFAGVNGSGKTTLLKICANVLRPSAGTVTRTSTWEGKRGEFARTRFLPQDFTFPSNQTVLEFVTFAAWVRGAGRRSEMLAIKALESTNLIEHRTLKLGRASGGIVRRTGFAACIVDEPDILILDEPTTGVDPEQRREMRDLITTHSHDRLTLMSSHVAEDIEAIADMLVVLRGGRVTFAGTTSQAKTTAGESSLEAAIIHVSRIRS